MNETTQTFTLVSPTGEKKEYTMKYSMWLDDQSDQMRLVTADKEINMKELWISRIDRAIDELSREQIMRIGTWEMSALILKWFEMNDVNKGTFLVDPKTKSEESTTTTP